LQEINEMLASRMSAADEEEVLAELAALQAEHVSLRSPPGPPGPKLTATVSVRVCCSSQACPTFRSAACPKLCASRPSRSNKRRSRRPPGRRSRPSHTEKGSGRLSHDSQIGVVLYSWCQWIRLQVPEVAHWACGRDNALGATRKRQTVRSQHAQRARWFRLSIQTRQIGVISNLSGPLKLKLGG